MYTREEIVSAMGSEALASQGSALQATGCVRQVRQVEHRGYTRHFGMVSDQTGMHMASFSYSHEQRQISGMDCECGGLPGMKKGQCAHVAALLFEVLARAAGEERQAVSILEKNRMDMAKRREHLRREALLREQEAREQEREELDAFISAARAGRAFGRQEEQIALLPMLSLKEGTLWLELRIGSGKPYVVRSLRDFARRMEQHTQTVYGRELTFSHREEDVVEADRALLWQIVAMAQGAPDGPRIGMAGAQLDQTMRLLIGRQVDFRGGDGKVVRLSVEPGQEAIPLALEQQAGRHHLSVPAQDVVLGTAGAYYVRAQEGRILCAFGEAFDAVAPLLRLREKYPQGAAMDGNQLAAICAGLIAPAAQRIAIFSGADVISAHTPMTLNNRFYIDIEEKNRLTCRLVHDYGAAQLSPGEDNPHIRRDADAEAAALEAVKRLFPVARETGDFAFEGNDDACFDLIERRVHALGAHGEVLLEERLARMDVKKRSAMSIGVSVSEPGMLLVKADLGGMTQEDLLAAYTAYRLKRKYVRLSGGEFLSGEALEQAADAAKTLESMDVTAQQAEQGAQVPASRALYLDEALKERKSIRLRAPKEVSDWVARLKKAQKVRAANPETLKATLRDYQLEGLSWLTALCESGFGGILADDMGLGKTMQALALLLACKERGEAVRALVVCPASLQLNWENEAEKFAPSLTACALMGDAKERLETLRAQPPLELMIVSYDQLRRDVQAYKGVRFTHIFLDEAQNIKNAASQAAKAVKTLAADHRFAMTGTPIENRLSELWSIFDFLMPGYLLTYKKFKEKFETPIVKEEDEKTLCDLRMMTAPFILRRMKADVLDDLPEKTEKIMTSEMTPGQKRVYHAHAAQLVAQADGGFADQKDAIRMLAGLTRLRQLCCDPRLCLENYEGGSGKLNQCLELTGEMVAGGHRVLLFSQFTSMLDILRTEMEARGLTTMLLTGATDKQERMEMVEAFNDGGAQVFLISLKAGGTGLNLTGADVVIHYDPWWNTSAQNQATDRAYRIGQKRGVQVFKLIAGDTIESRILKLQQHKSELSDGVLSAEENLFTMDAQALGSLLR